ncbi:MAG TPA: hypothetical protein VMH84_13535 [Xanthobacteraceae bacterium]|nr:hypothetical protein [Xanthobacteraceae bacterium]
MAKIRSKILNVFWTFVEYRRALASRMFDPYRPELHYMRGPGPRWREKQDS